MSDAGRAVFLSYASQDAEAARRLCDALRAQGVEVWLDADGGLQHGDEWDAKIRRQIKECVLFIPLISASTQARHEGYFRIEWELAAQRALGIASGVPFILPVVIDDTREPEALVPDRFRMVQWTRLPGGEVSPELKRRFLNLWSQRTGSSRSPLAGDAVPIAGQPIIARKRAPTWGIGAAALVLLAGAWLWSNRSSIPNGQQTITNHPAAPAAALAKVWALLNKPELARGELDAAYSLCEQAVAADRNDADAWAAWAFTETWYSWFGFDGSPARRDSARTKVARAVLLEPDSYEVRLAQVNYLVRGAAQLPLTAAVVGEAEPILRGLLRQQPDEPRALFLLGMLGFLADNANEDMSALERLEKNPAFAAVAAKEIGYQHYWAGRWAKAEEAVNRSIALLPYWDNLELKIVLALNWRGDLDLAKATLDRLPPSILQEEGSVGFVEKVLRWRRESRELVAYLETIPQDWIETLEFSGPKAYLTGRARLLGNQGEAASRDFRRALVLIDKRLETDPNNPELLGVKALTHYYLGEQGEADKYSRLVHEMRGTWPGMLPELVVNLMPATDAINELERQFSTPESLSSRWAFNLTAASLRLNPAYDPLRTDPRFAALLARAEADPRKSPGAKQGK